MANIPQPTMVEMQHARARLPDRAKGASDAQLQQMIMQKRHEDALKTNPQYQQRFSLLQAQQGQYPMNNLRHPQMPQPLGGQAQHLPQGHLHQPPQPQQASMQKFPPTTQGGQAQSNRAGTQNYPPANHVAPQRNISDDVIEVPNPRIANQQNRPLNDRAAPLHGMSQTTQEAFAKMSPEQRVQLQQRMQAQAAQHAKGGLPGQNASGHASAPAANLLTSQSAGRENRLNQLINEVAQTTPHQPVIPMSPETRSQMISGLKKDTGGMIHRIEQSLPVFLNKVQDEKQAKELLKIVSLPLKSACLRANPPPAIAPSATSQNSRL